MIAYYVLEGNRPLTAESGGNTTYYLYGLGAIGEKTTDWAYSLLDGVNTPRQLADPTGDITLSARYTPWGDTLETYGIGNFTFGYFGGVMDAATGLLYVGNGQYYDPVTGRFLTRDANPNSPNPYVPWNPLGALIGPLGLLALVYGRRKKGNKVGMLLALLLVGASVGMMLAGCGPGGENSGGNSPTVPNEAPTVPPNSNQTPGGPGIYTGSTPSPSGTPTLIPEIPECPTAPTIQIPSTLSPEDVLDIYTVAGLHTQSPFLINTRHRTDVYTAALFFPNKNPYYIGIGIAKVTDAQMETAQGEPINGGSNGIGLGLRTERCGFFYCPAGQLDQDDNNVAYTAMRTRISLRTKVCLNNGCTETDNFIVAALAENESINPNEVRIALNHYKQHPPLQSVIINWHEWLKIGDPNNLDYNLKLFKIFKNNVGNVSNLGVDDVYINNLLQNP